MLDLFLKIFPFALASVISPVMLGIMILILGDKEHSKRKVIEFFIGSFLAVMILTLLGYFLGSNISGSGGFHFSSLVNYIFALLLVILAIRFFFKRKPNNPPKVETQDRFIRWFLTGLLITIINDSAVLYLIQVKEIYQSQVMILPKLIINLVSIFFLLLPALFPLSVYVFVPATASKVIDPVADAMKKYSNYVLATLFLIFGLVYLLKGLKIFG
jgi:putative Ca2+/H+ antiporter (TMEM165/GDT1 family)